MKTKNDRKRKRGAAVACTDMVRRWLKRYSPGRRDRLAALKRQRAKQQLDKLEASLESMMLTLPAGFERRQCNNDLFRVRTMRAISGV